MTIKANAQHEKRRSHIHSFCSTESTPHIWELVIVVCSNITRIRCVHSFYGFAIIVISNSSSRDSDTSSDGMPEWNQCHIISQQHSIPKFSLSRIYSFEWLCAHAHTHPTPPDTKNIFAFRGFGRFVCVAASCQLECGRTALHHFI